jgi:serine/threonine protein kinase
MTPVMPMVGEDLAGYRLRSVVSRGGMSVVYQAENSRLGSIVALKVLAAELAADDAFRTRFLQESRVAASLAHPNVIPIYDTGPCGELLYISMRYVTGSDLRTVLKAHGALAPDQALLLIGQAGRALDAAHRTGLVHRDVKPGNILVEGGVDNEPDHVYLADFGISKHTMSRSGLTATGEFVGTIDYIAPEQIQGKPLDGRADIYSLGCVLYECLTGRVPFKKEIDAAVLWAHVEELPPAPSGIRPELTQAVDDVIFRAVAKDPDDRYPTCRDFVAAARAAVEETLSNHPAAPPKDARAPQTVLTGASAPPPAPHVPALEGRALTPTDFSPRRPPLVPNSENVSAGDRGNEDRTGVFLNERRSDEAAPKTPLTRPRRPVLIPIAVVVIAIAAGLAIWVTSRGSSSKSPAPTVSASSRTNNPILQALAVANHASGGLVAPSSCSVESASMVSCNNPAGPDGGVNSVSFRTFASLPALYAAYVAAVRPIAGGTFRQNFNDCNLNTPNGEVSWNHDAHHSKSYALAQVESGRLDVDSQAAGRVFCNVAQDGLYHLVWTQNPAGRLLGVLTGQTHELAWQWWREIHHDISIRGSQPSTQMSMSKG